MAVKIPLRDRAAVAPRVGCQTRIANSDEQVLIRRASRFVVSEMHVRATPRRPTGHDNVRVGRIRGEVLRGTVSLGK